MARHDGRVALVTGAGQGIGRGIALALAKDGATVAVVGRTLEKLEGTCNLIDKEGGSSVPIVCDIVDAAQTRACVAELAETYGRLDILVNNAQVKPDGKLLDIAAETLYEAIETGPMGAFRLMREAHPHLKESRGTIINVGSGAQYLHDAARYSFGPYVAAKYMMLSLTRTAAVEWGSDGIRALLILPAAWTEMSLAAAKRRGDDINAMSRNIPVGRMGDPEKDIGRPVSWLCSEEAGYLTGTVITLDGGQIFLR